jgi:hypothetical protein
LSLSKEKITENKEKKEEKKTLEKKTENNNNKEKNSRSPFLDNIPSNKDIELNKSAKPFSGTYNSKEENFNQKKVKQEQVPKKNIENKIENKEVLMKKSSEGEYLKKPIKLPSPAPIQIKENNPKENLQKKETTSSSGFLLILLLVISLITLASGYYYFYYLKQGEVSEKITEKVENENKKEENFPVNKTINFSVISLDNEKSLIDQIKNKKNEIINSQNFKIEKDKKNINKEILLNEMGINLPQEILENINDVFINLNKENQILKVGLIFEIKNPEKVRPILLNNEPFLPEMLSPLFIDEAFILQDEEVSFMDSDKLKGVRYYNLVEGFNDKAIDWKILELENDYLFITTSQKTMDDLISNFKNSQINFEEEKVDDVENQEIGVGEIQNEAGDFIKELFK